MRYVEPALAQSYAEAAVNHPLGVMEDNGDNAVVQSNAIYNYVNPLTMLWQGYKETKMGAPMDSYMNGYKDPKRAKYFSPVGTGTYARQYKGARFGYSRAADYAVCSAPMVSEGGPLYFMTAAEIFFLRAEGAIEGWSMGGTAGELYNRGIETSMVQWGVSGGEVTAYQNNATDTPAAYQDVVSSANNVAAPSTVTIKWNDGDIRCRFPSVKYWLSAAEAVISEAIRDHIVTDHSANFVREINRDRRDWDVSLDNGLELKFDRRLRLVEYDGKTGKTAPLKTVESDHLS